MGLDGGAWSENYQITKSTKCVHLLKRLYDIGAAVNPALPETYTQKVPPSFAATLWQSCKA